MKNLLIIAMLLSCSLTGAAQTFFNIDGIRYMIEDDHAVIARQDQELSGEVIIPATVTCGETDYNVTRMISPNECDDNGAFQGCQITGITLPTSITEIPPFAFYRCNSLSSVTIPQNVTTIGYVAFAECSKLSSFNVAEGNSYYSSENGVLFNKNKTILLQYPQAKSETSYNIPNSVGPFTRHIMEDQENHFMYEILLGLIKDVKRENIYNVILDAKCFFSPIQGIESAEIEDLQSDMSKCLYDLYHWAVKDHVINFMKEGGNNG